MVSLTSEINSVRIHLHWHELAFQVALSSSCVTCTIFRLASWSCYHHFTNSKRFNTHFISSSSTPSRPRTTSNLSSPFTCPRKWHLCNFYILSSVKLPRVLRVTLSRPTWKSLSYVDIWPTLFPCLINNTSELTATFLNYRYILHRSLQRKPHVP